MKPETIVAIVACCISCGGILIFIGRSLGTLQSIGDAVKVALAKTDKHETDIAQIKVDLAKIGTRQEDCKICP